MNLLRQTRKLLALMACAFLSLLLTHCGNKAADISNNFSSIYATTFKTANCVFCHAPGTSTYVTKQVPIDFTTVTTAYSTLTGSNVSGISSIGTCSGVKIVSAGYPAQSYLAGVLFQSYATANFASKSGCTPYATHLSDQNISAAEQAAIIAWITAGALNN